MKKSLIALAVLGAFSGVALAQSSVKLDGTLDVGLQSVKNGSAAGGSQQKSMITNHIARTVQGWLAIGPDNRGEFSRQGN